MKIIYFIRSASYDYLVPGLDLYDSFNAVIKKTTTPAFTQTKQSYLANLPEELLRAEAIFSSPEKRCYTTAGFLNSSVKKSECLGEVRYEMEDFISKKEFFLNGVPQVDKARKLFVAGLIGDKLHESYTLVIKRVEELNKLLLSTEVQSIVCISHGFILKVIEAYYRDKNLKNDRKLLTNYFSGEKQTFGFGRGFKVKIEGSSIEVSYI